MGAPAVIAGTPPARRGTVAPMVLPPQPGTADDVPAVPHLAQGRAPTPEEGIADLFDQHYAGLCRLAALLLADRAAAEEVVQEAFLRTFAGWRRIRRPERAQWYLRAAVVNQCRSRARRRVSEERGNRTVWATEGRREGEEWEGDRAGEALGVLEAVRALPTRQREAVVLRYYEDLGEADVASVLGCSVGTVKSQLAKARATLARLLDQPENDEPERAGDG